MPPKRKTAAAAKADRLVKNVKSTRKEKTKESTESSTITPSTKRKHEEDEDDAEVEAAPQAEAESSKPGSSLSDRMAKLKELKKRRVCIETNKRRKAERN
jgi:FMN phosphatase YigB (HAD superfamily)